MEKIEELQNKVKVLENRLKNNDPNTMVGSMLVKQIDKLKAEIEKINDIAFLEAQYKLYKRNANCSTYKKYWPQYQSQCKKLELMIKRRKDGS